MKNKIFCLIMGFIFLWSCQGSPTQKLDYAEDLISIFEDENLGVVVSDILEIIDSLQSKIKDQGEKTEIFGSASSIFEDQIKNDPQNIWPRLNLAYSLMKQFKYRESFDQYLTCLKMNPDIADPFIGIGRLFYTLAVLDMNDRKLTSHSSSGLTMYHPDEKVKNIFVAAKKNLLLAKTKQRLMKKNPDGTSIYVSNPGAEDEFIEMTNAKLLAYYWRKGFEFEKNENNEKALEYYNEALLIDLNNFELLSNKGNVLFKLNRFTEAIQYYDLALKLKPLSVDIINNRELSRIRLNGLSWPRDSRLIAFLKKEAESADKNIRLGAVLLLVTLSKTDKNAEETLIQIVTTNPNIQNEIENLKK